MESMRRGEANTSHHQNKVALNSLGTDSNKQTNNSCNNNINNNSKQSASIQSTELKETNFEYDDNEWDVGGIGDLLIDLDADIAKSTGTSQSSISSTTTGSLSTVNSTTNTGNNTPNTNQSIGGGFTSKINTTSSTSATPLRQSQFSSSKSSAFTATNIIKSAAGSGGGVISSNTASGLSKTQSQLLIHSKQQQTGQNIIANNTKPIVPSALIAQLNSSNKKINVPENIISLGNTSNILLQNQTSDPDRVKTLQIQTTMSSTPGGGGTGKATTKMSMDHQATLDKGLKMKIKRTKPGTKTSEAKHEIVKAEQNGTSSNLDDSNNSSSNSGSKKHSQISTPPVVPPPTTPQATKRGNSSHRRDKTRDKTPHSQREKGDHNNSSTTQSNSDRCNCSLDIQVNGIQTPCSSLTCIRIRTTDPNSSSLGQRIIGSNNSSSNSSSIPNSNSISSNNTTGGIFSTNTNSTQNTGSGTPNAPGPPKESTGKISSTPSSQQISNITQSQQQSLNQSSSSSSIKSQNCTNSTSISSASSLTSNSSSNSSSSNSSSIDEKCSSSPPPAKKIKCEPKEMVDMCVGTSVGTITEPDCLGPCEPGTSVTLEGIVWHETEGGVLVVNVTWRGKTYVGTLLDCTRHDWAPPRFCDSPTEELDSRTPKGRGKRGRSATILPCNDLSNFTETRSSVHSKLRNGGAKGRGGRTSTTTGSTTTTTTTTTSTVTSGNTITNSSSNSSNTPSSSPTAFLPPRPEKRKSKDESPSPVNGDSATQSVVNPVTGLNVQITTKKCKTASPCAVSPVLLECPEQDCSKKYKHANGLRYHQSHAHGSGSMDEDSMQPPESPQRIVPSTTPSPVPSSTPQNPINQTNSGQPSTPTSSQSTTVGISSDSISTPTCTVASTNTTTTTTPSIIPPVNTSNTNSNPTVSANIPGPTLPLQQSPSVPPQQIPQQPPLNALLQQQQQMQPGSIQTPTSNAGSTASLLATVNNNSTNLNSQPPPQQLQQPPLLPANQIPQNLTQPSPASGAGGSITAGISGQMVQQHIMATTNPLLVNASPSILGQTISDASLSTLNPQQQQPQPQMTMNNGITSTPTRNDSQSKVKPGVLRFGPPPPENDRLQDFNNLFPVAPTNTQSGPAISSNPGPIRPSPVNALTGNAVPQQTIGTPDGVPNYNSLQQSQQNLSQSSPVAAFKVKSTASLMPSQVGGTVVNSITNKPQNYGKTKKSRKSPGPGDYENAATQRAEDVQSPAYSDISDDSTPVTEPEIGDKSQSIKHNDSTKKPPETTPGQLGSVGGYGMYPFYAQTPYIVPSDHPQNKPPVSQSQMSQQTPGDYSNKNKDPPLDLMNKQGNQTSDLSSQSKESGPTTQPNKILPHFYPSYNYMNPGGYPPYNIDPNYGAVSLITDENKMNSSSQPNSMGGGIKEERSKENPSPSEHVKMSPQMMSSKLIKSEPQLSKDIKLDSMHGKDSISQSLCGYPGMYQRHGLGVAPPPQHISREDDIRRYYIYPEQRRSSTSSNSSSTNLQGGMKDEPPSPSQTLPPQNMNQQSSQSVGSQQSSKQSKSSGQNMSQQQSQKSSSLMKDQKPDEKELLKVKQEGQKPTMETQGPPPPPTSQYYLHHSYMSPSYGFDPAHQMYRNMLVPAAPYNPTPYHLQMPRYHPPEDLSRNPNTKALDLLQHHASQYYNTHKIHELSERALKSPTSNVKVAVSSPNVSQQSNTNSNVGMQQQNTAGSGLSHQPPSSAVPPSAGGPVVGGVPLNASKPTSDKTSTEPTKDGQNNGRSPPPQRHVHTHHHTHVGLTYPMYPAPYQAAVLASQQAAAVAVINPFPPAPPTK